MINPRRACAARVIVLVRLSGLSTLILELQATERPMSDINGFSAIRARKIMWRILPKRPSSRERNGHCVVDVA